MERPHRRMPIPLGSSNVKSSTSCCICVAHSGMQKSNHSTISSSISSWVPSQERPASKYSNTLGAILRSGWSILQTCSCRSPPSCTFKPKPHINANARHTRVSSKVGRKIATRIRTLGGDIELRCLSTDNKNPPWVPYKRSKRLGSSEMGRLRVHSHFLATGVFILLTRLQ
jgi:hypothetical protein